jgi:2,4-diketo-3-deoxy-L-fuconate hydrolase
MKLCTYSRGDAPRVGFLLDDDRVADLREAADALSVAVPAGDDLRSLVDVANLPALGELQRAAHAAPRDAAWARPVADVTLHAPFRPRQNVLCAGGNTRDAHAGERIRGGKPWLNYYTKAPSATNGPGAPISWPRQITSEVYAEPQLAVVIGTHTSFVEADDALEHVFGYAVATSVVSADLKRKHGQWDKAVSLDTFFCWGPVIVTADEADISDITGNLWLNDRMAISGAIEGGLLTTAEVISEISFGMRMEAGEVILTGVPEAIGFGQEPERWLQDGDTVRSSIDGIGTIENPVASYTFPATANGSLDPS